jgi:hypothetical protein
MLTSILSPSTFASRGESRVVQSRSRGRVGVRAHRCRSASNSKVASRGLPRSKSRSRSSSASRKGKPLSVRFEEPSKRDVSALAESATGSDVGADIAEKFHRMSLSYNGASVAESDRLGFSALSPARNRLRNRSASAKRRSRPICREIPTRRRRDARAPSRGRGRSSSEIRGGKSARCMVKKGVQRARSRSPVDRATRWLYAVRAERNCNLNTPLPSFSTKQAQRDGMHPILRSVASDDNEERLTHERILLDFGYRPIDGRPP